jgi:hypothetical protein
MDVQSDSPTGLEAIDEASKWGVGAGILIFALFPLAVPILLLTLVAVLPLAVPVIALGLVGGVVAGPVLLVRRLLRSRAGRSVRNRSSSPRPHSATARS